VIVARAMSGIMEPYIRRAQEALPGAHPAKHLEIALSMFREEMRERAHRAGLASVAARRAKRAQQFATHPVVERIADSEEDTTPKTKKLALKSTERAFSRSTSDCSHGVPAEV
jgi:hypothetical protein